MKQVALIVVGVGVFAAILSGQGTAPQADAMHALVAEIRGLRTDLNRVAGSSIRSQLLVGRLQLQEQRILTLSRQIGEVQKDIASASQVRVVMETEIKNMEEAEGEEGEQARKAAAHLRPQLTQHEQREQQLRSQESTLSVLIAEEQARWIDLSSRLDELERALSAPSK